MQVGYRPQLSKSFDDFHGYMAMYDIGNEDVSLFVNRLVENFHVPYIWIPFVVVLLCIIVKNSKIQASVLTILMIVSISILISLVGFSLCGLLTVITYLLCLIKSRQLMFILGIWSIICAYTFWAIGMSMMDICCEMIGGIIIGILLHILYRYMLRLFSIQANYISSQYTSSGYLVGDISFLHTIMLLTYFFIIILSLIN